MHPTRLRRLVSGADFARCASGESFSDCPARRAGDAPVRPPVSALGGVDGRVLSLLGRVQSDDRRFCNWSVCFYHRDYWKGQTIIEPSPAMRLALALFGLLLMGMSVGSYFIQGSPGSEGAPVRQLQQPATAIATQELSPPTLSSDQVTQQPSVTQLPAPTTAPRECSGQGFMPPIPGPPPQGCVLTVEWWYPPDPTPCGLWITYGAVEFDDGVAGYWWYEYDVTVPEHIRAFKEKYDYCEVKDFR